MYLFLVTVLGNKGIHSAAVAAELFLYSPHFSACLCV